MQSRTPITVKQAAAQLGVSVQMVYRLFQQRKLDGHRVESAVRIYPESLDEYIKSRRNVVATRKPEKQSKRRSKAGGGSTASYLRFMAEVDRYRQKHRLG